MNRLFLMLVPDVCSITLKALSPSTNVEKLAKDILRKCKYIHPSKVAKVEGLLRELQARAIASKDISTEKEKNSATVTKASPDSSDDARVPVVPDVVEVTNLERATEDTKQADVRAPDAISGAERGSARKEDSSRYDFLFLYIVFCSVNHFLLILSFPFIRAVHFRDV